MTCLTVRYELKEGLGEGLGEVMDRVWLPKEPAKRGMRCDEEQHLS
jgi:hypothetical protein